MSDEAKKYKAADFSPGDAVKFKLPNGKPGNGVVKVASTPYMQLEDGRKVRAGSCQPG